MDLTTQFLIKNWTQETSRMKLSPPQVWPLAAGSKVYSACGEQLRGIEVGGSAYCLTSHTIYLVPEELKGFYPAFGGSAVAHEFGHPIQAAYRIKLQRPARELQADCLAGLLFRIGSKDPGITRDNVVAMGSRAYSIGGTSHGSGAQRAYALLTGMGVINASCQPKVMQALAEGRHQGTALRALSPQRSDCRRIDISQTPYPKTLQTAHDL